MVIHMINFLDTSTRLTSKDEVNKRGILDLRFMRVRAAHPCYRRVILALTCGYDVRGRSKFLKLCNAEIRHLIHVLT